MSPRAEQPSVHAPRPSPAASGPGPRGICTISQGGNPGAFTAWGLHCTTVSRVAPGNRQTDPFPSLGHTFSAEDKQRAAVPRCHAVLSLPARQASSTQGWRDTATLTAGTYRARDPCHALLEVGYTDQLKTPLRGMQLPTPPVVKGDRAACPRLSPATRQ